MSQSDRDVHGWAELSQGQENVTGKGAQELPGRDVNPNARAQPALAGETKAALANGPWETRTKSGCKSLIAPGLEESGSLGTVVATLMHFDGYPHSPGMASPCGDRALRQNIS